MGIFMKKDRNEMMLAKKYAIELPVLFKVKLKEIIAEKAQPCVLVRE